MTNVLQIKQRRDFLNVKQTAELLNVSHSTIYKFVRERKIKFVRVGCQIRFERSDIENLNHDDAPEMKRAA